MGPSSLSGRTSRVSVQGSGDDDSKACGSTVSIRIPWTVPTPDRLFGSHLWRMTHVALPLDIISNWSIASFSVHFLYKYHTSFFISPLSAKTHCQSASVILVRDHSVQLLYPSSTPFFRSHTNLVSTLFFTSLFYLQIYSVYFPRLYTPSPFLDPSES